MYGSCGAQLLAGVCSFRVVLADFGTSSVRPAVATAAGQLPHERSIALPRMALLAGLRSGGGSHMYGIL